MKFLQKLIGVVSLFFLMAATQDDSLRNNRAAAVQVTCGGRTWTDGELLGRDNGNRVWTLIVENRIYIRKENSASYAHDNTGVLFHLDTNLFPVDTPAGQSVVDCVNKADPSTYNNGYLGAQVGNVIPCNNKPISDKLYLGVFTGDDHVKSFQYARIINGRLRVNLQREGYNIGNYNDLNFALILTTAAGNGGVMNPNMGFTLSPEEIKNCFWPAEPLLAVPVVSKPVCASGPTLQSIANVTKTSLRFTFAGTSIPNVQWSIKSNGAEVRSGTTSQLSGTTTVDISFASLNTGTYSLEIQGGECTSSVTSQSFTVTTPACNGGPAISSINNVTSTSLTVGFAGTNIPNLNWAIKSGVSTIASGKTANLSSNSATLNFSNLVNGAYKLEIQGGDCSSAVSSQDFTVSAPCARGPIVQAVSSITNTGLSFLFDGDGVYGIGWKIMKGNTVMRESSVSPTSNRPSISFNSLADGAYQIQIQGSTCNSTPSVMAFGINVALPIYISSFEAAAVKEGIDLSWNVVSEKNGEGFEILRLDSELKKPEIIGKLSLTEQRMGEYHFLDENPAAGTNYYQLKQIDMDGTFTLSKIIGAKFDQIFEAIVAPNPASDYVNVQFTSRTSGVALVELYNMAGIKLSSSQVNMTEGKNTHRLNVGKLTDGHYFFKVLHADQSSDLRFVKIN